MQCRLRCSRRGNKAVAHYSHSSDVASTVTVSKISPATVAQPWAKHDVLIRQAEHCVRAYDCIARRWCNNRYTQRVRPFFNTACATYQSHRSLRTRVFGHTETLSTAFTNN